MRPRPRRSSNAARPSSASGGCAIALSPTASRKPATACSPSHGCRQLSGEAREQRTRSSVCTKSSSGGSRRRPCCRRQKQQRCCSGRCSPLVRSTCARLMVGRRSPQSPSISRLTSPRDRILSKCRRSRHRIPTPLATAPSRLAVILFAASLIILWGNAAMTMTLKSPAFQQDGHIPSKYTCEGEDVSPPLAWEDAPNGAKSLVLIIDDPDAPDPKAPKMVWVHWVVYNMPPDTKSLPENAGKARLPLGALLGLNDFQKTGYGGPCPPIGRHRYFHKLYALDITLDLRDATKSQIERAMRGHVLANAELIGTYQKGDR